MTASKAVPMLRTKTIRGIVTTNKVTSVQSSLVNIFVLVEFFDTTSLCLLLLL